MQLKYLIKKGVWDEVKKMVKGAAVSKMERFQLLRQ
jgi:hypothetical protein